MNTQSNPSTVHRPIGQYTHTISVPVNARWLVLSGQVGIDRKASLHLARASSVNKLFEIWLPVCVTMG